MRDKRESTRPLQRLLRLQGSPTGEQQADEKTQLRQGKSKCFHAEAGILLTRVAAGPSGKNDATASAGRCKAHSPAELYFETEVHLLPRGADRSTRRGAFPSAHFPQPPTAVGNPPLRQKHGDRNVAGLPEECA